MHIARRRLAQRRALRKGTVRPVLVVVQGVGREDVVEVAAADDQDPVEAFAADAADPAFGVRFRPRCRDRRPDHFDPVRAAERVEGLGEFDVAVADQDPRLSALVAEGREQLARLLGDPAAVGMSGDAGDVDAPPLEFDEEEDVVAA